MWYLPSILFESIIQPTDYNDDDDDDDGNKRWSNDNNNNDC